MTVTTVVGTLYKIYIKYVLQRTLTVYWVSVMCIAYSAVTLLAGIERYFLPVKRLFNLTSHRLCF